MFDIQHRINLHQFIVASMFNHGRRLVNRRRFVQNRSIRIYPLVSFTFTSRRTLVLCWDEEELSVLRKLNVAFRRRDVRPNSSYDEETTVITSRLTGFLRCLQQWLIHSTAAVELAHVWFVPSVFSSTRRKSIAEISSLKLEIHFADGRRGLEYEFIRSESARSLFVSYSQRKFIRWNSWNSFWYRIVSTMRSTRKRREKSKIHWSTVPFCSSHFAVLLLDDDVNGEVRVAPLVIVDAVAIKWIWFSLGKLRSFRIVYKMENITIILVFIIWVKKTVARFVPWNHCTIRGALGRRVCLLLH